MKRKVNLKVLIALVLSFAISFAIILVTSIPEAYDYKVGDICEHDIFAPRDIEDKYETQKKRENMANSIEDQYSENKSITEAKIEELKEALNTISDARNNISLTKKEKIGYVKDYLGDGIGEDSIAYLLSLGDEGYTKFTKMVQTAFGEVMGGGVHDSEEALDDIEALLREREKTEALILAAREIVKNYAVENMEYDEELTLKRKEDARNSVAPVIYKENKLIAATGDELTEAQIQLLSDIGLIKADGRIISIKYGVGIFVLLFAFYGIAVYYIKLKSGRKRLSSSKLILSGVLPVIMLFIIFAFSGLKGNMAYIIPVPWCSVLIATFVSMRLSAVCSVYMSFATAIMLGLREEYIIAMVIFSTIASVIFKRVEGISGYAKAMVYTIIMGSASMAVSMLVTGKTWNEILMFAGLGAANGLLTSILVIGTTPIFENVFNIITPFKLNDLGNPEKPLLKRLMFEAPGTYHHSLMVGNLAEAACIKIGANNQFARVAAYYHDVGKLRRPGYFVENQMGENPHDSLMPDESSEVIRAHVEDGIEIAKQYRLPKDIQDVIVQHHGRTVTGFFYNKAKEMNPSAKQSDFMYPGPKPESKEAGIVMLADSCEAAVRSMDEKTEETIRAMVTKIVKSRMAEGELDNCDLCFRELGEIIEAFVSMLGSHFHKRIKYDKEPKNNGTDNRKDN